MTSADASAIEPLRDVIARHGLQASKALGQNFILDRQLLARIAAVPGSLQGQTVYEVGPGPGGLTRALLDAGATVLAVEMAVIHNFLWHEHVTWADRKGLGSHWATRFVKFNLSNGLLSIVGNVILMQALVSGAGMNYVVANVMTIAACSVVNFLVSDKFVFQV